MLRIYKSIKCISYILIWIQFRLLEKKLYFLLIHALKTSSINERKLFSFTYSIKHFVKFIVQIINKHWDHINFINSCLHLAINISRNAFTDDIMVSHNMNKGVFIPIHHTLAAIVRHALCIPTRSAPAELYGIYSEYTDRPIIRDYRTSKVYIK